MKVQKIGVRGTLFSFVFEFNQEELSVAIYVIEGSRHRFVYDTGLGPGAIDQVAVYFGDAFWERPIIVINSHAHFDHFWGNCAFKDQPIVAHSLCRENILKPVRAQFLRDHPEFQLGEVEIVPPNLTFEKRLVFPEDQVEITHSPGHTQDSVSCIDWEDRVLLVGDNIGFPIPSIYPVVNLDDYIHTLETYKRLGLPTIIASHYGEVGPEDLDSHLDYLGKLKAGDAGEYETGEYKEVHTWNLRVLGSG